jgi:hypothetical protein
MFLSIATAGQPAADLGFLLHKQFVRWFQSWMKPMRKRGGLIANGRAGRGARLIEHVPGYFDVILRRYESRAGMRCATSSTPNILGVDCGFEIFAYPAT